MIIDANIDPARPRRASARHRRRVEPLRRRDRACAPSGRTGSRSSPRARDVPGRQRADRLHPPVPGAGRPADAARDQGRAEGPHAGVHRRRQQHGSFAAAGRRHGRGAGPRRQPARLRAAGAGRTSRERDRCRHRRRGAGHARSARGRRATPTLSTPTSGRRWARRPKRIRAPLSSSVPGERQR